MERVKPKKVRIRHGTSEPASSSGENNDQSGRSSCLPEEGEHSHNFGGVAWVESSSVKLLNDGGGNTANQPNKLAGVIYVNSQHTVTPRLAS